MEGPCRQISSLSAGSFHSDKESHWHSEALCTACVCFRALAVVWAKRERISHLIEIPWAGAICQRACAQRAGTRLKRLGRKKALWQWPEIQICCCGRVCFIFIWCVRLQQQRALGAGEASGASPTRPSVAQQGLGAVGWWRCSARIAPVGSSQFKGHQIPLPCFCQRSECKRVLPLAEGRAGTSFISKDLNQIFSRFINVWFWWADELHLYLISLLEFVKRNGRLRPELAFPQEGLRAFFTGTSRGYRV